MHPPRDGRFELPSYGTTACSEEPAFSMSFVSLPTRKRFFVGMADLHGLTLSLHGHDKTGLNLFNMQVSVIVLAESLCKELHLLVNMSKNAGYLHKTPNYKIII